MPTRSLCATTVSRSIELHLMDPRQSYRRRSPMTGDIFYHLAGNDVIDAQLTHKQAPKQIIVPARDVLHIRLHCVERKRPFPLKGKRR